MSLEAIVTTVDVDSNSDELEITLWRFGTIRVPFTSFPFRTRHVSEKELDSLKARMDEFSKQTNTSYEIVRSMKSRNNPDGKPNITLTAPPSIATELPEDISRYFFKGHYAEHARETYVRPGEVITIDDQLANTLSGIKEYTSARSDVKNKLFQHDPSASQSAISRRDNELERIVLPG